MVRLVAERAVSLVFVILGLTLIIFAISNIIPSDSAQVAAGLSARKEQVEAIRKELGWTARSPNSTCAISAASCAAISGRRSSTAGRSSTT